MDVTPITAASQGATASVKNVTITNQMFQSTQEGLTAHAAGGQGLATPINSMCARFTTVATLHDSCILPTSLPGLEITIINAGAAGLDVYPDLGGQINLGGVNAVFTILQGKTAIFYTTAPLTWHSILSA